jgi:hypothetical protein
MSLVEFQRLMVELTLSPRKATALRHGDTTLLDRAELTFKERTRLRDLVGQRGISVHCSLSRGNRLEAVAEAFPMTCTVLGPSLRPLLDEHWEQSLPSNYQLVGLEAEFGAFLERKVRQGGLELEYLPEVLEYEMTCLELTYEARRLGGARVSREFRFEHDPATLLPPLSRMEPPTPGLRPGDFPCEIVLEEGRFDVVPRPVTP